MDALYREFDKTVAEVVREFGYNNVSQAVRTLYDNGGLDQRITLIHAIEPREVRSRGKTAKHMPWRSVYLEKNALEGHVLRESGYPRFPAVCPRWGVAGGNIYGTSPGMEALGDIRQLQHQQLRKATAIDYLTNPPLQVPTTTSCSPAASFTTTAARRLRRCGRYSLTCNTWPPICKKCAGASTTPSTPTCS